MEAFFVSAMRNIQGDDNVWIEEDFLSFGLAY